MPLTAKGTEIKAALTKEYGEKKGEQVLYAGKNKGTFTGIDEACARMDASMAALADSMRADARTVKSLTPEEILEMARRRVEEKEKQGRVTSLSQEVSKLNREQKTRGDSIARMDASIKAFGDANDMEWDIKTRKWRKIAKMRSTGAPGAIMPWREEEKMIAERKAAYAERMAKYLEAKKRGVNFLDSLQAMNDSVNALKDRMDDRRVVGGVNARFDAKEAEHTLELTFDGDFNMAGLIRALHYLGGIGASRTLDIAIDDRDTQGDLKKKGIPSKLGWDGDGADKIRSAKLDGADILK